MNKPPSRTFNLTPEAPQIWYKPCSQVADEDLQQTALCVNHSSAVQQQLQNETPSQTPAVTERWPVEDAATRILIAASFLSFHLYLLSPLNEAGQLANNIFFTQFLQQLNEKLHLLKAGAFITSQT